MTRRTEDRARNWLPLGLAFLLGLFIGWWVIGWWLWPVTYTNALPPDLRSEEKGQYLGMVADSYATTSDLKTAQDRTATWTKDQLATDLGTLQSRLAQQGNPQAEHVQMLATALSLAPAPAPVPSPAAPQQNLLGRICPAALWVLLALAGIVALVWLWREWRRRSNRPGPAPAPDTAPRTSPALWPATSPADIADQEETRWDEPGATEAGATAQTGAVWEPVDTDADADQPPAATRPASYAPPPDTAPAARSGPAPAEAAAAAAAGAAAAASAAPPKLTKVGEFVAAYHAGEPDYDEGFDIKDTSGAVVAMCGLGLMSPVGRGSDQAAALQVWLWEKSDQFTQVQVLMSENAYKDTALREQLAEEYPALPIRQGSEFDMQTHGFLLHGIVERIVYEEGEEINRIFNHLAVRLRVFQKERA